MLSFSFEIEAKKKDEVQKNILEINRKLRKNKLKEVESSFESFTKTETKRVKFLDIEETISFNIPCFNVSIKLDIENDSLKKEGFLYLGNLSSKEGIPFFYSLYPDKPLNQESFLGLKCVHCNTSLRAFAHYVEKDGAKQAFGKQCFKDLFGFHYDEIALDIQLLREFEEKNTSEEENLGFFSSGKKDLYIGELIFACKIAFSLSNKWQKGNEFKQGSASIIREVLFLENQETINFIKESIEGKEFQKLPEVEIVKKALLKELEILHINRKTDFDFNTFNLLGFFDTEENKVILKDYIIPYKLGLSGYFIFKVLNNLFTPDYEKLQKEGKKLSSHIGEIGETSKGFFKLLDKSLEASPFAYNASFWKCKAIEESSGNIIHFNNSGMLGSELEIGESYKLTFKIKEYLTFDHYKATIASFVKLDIPTQKEEKKLEKELKRLVKKYSPKKLPSGFSGFSREDKISFVYDVCFKISCNLKGIFEEIEINFLDESFWIEEKGIYQEIEENIQKNEKNFMDHFINM